MNIDKEKMAEAYIEWGNSNLSMCNEFHLAETNDYINYENFLGGMEMEQFKLKVQLETEGKKVLTELPRTPFFIKDNESFQRSIYMVVNNKNYYSYINLEDGDFIDQKDTEDYVLNRINSGRDTLLKSDLKLSANWSA